MPGRRPTISFTAEPPHAGGRSFCNHYGATYTLRGDSLRMTQFQGTAVGCGGVGAPEDRYFAALGRTRSFEVDSAVLVLIAEDGTRLTFVRSDTLAGARAR